MHNTTVTRCTKVYTYIHILEVYIHMYMKIHVYSTVVAMVVMEEEKEGRKPRTSTPHLTNTIRHLGAQPGMMNGLLCVCIQLLLGNTHVHVYLSRAKR